MKCGKAILTVTFKDDLFFVHKICFELGSFGTMSARVDGGGESVFVIVSSNCLILFCYFILLGEQEIVVGVKPTKLSEE